MTRIFSYTQPIEADIVDAYCALQKGFTDQFVYYRKDRPVRFMGMGRCIALPALDGIECELEGPVGQQPVFFSFNRFDAENPSPTDELFEAFPRLKFMLPEVILVEDDRGAYILAASRGSPAKPPLRRAATAAPSRSSWSPTRVTRGARTWKRRSTPSGGGASARWCCRAASASRRWSRSRRRTCW